MQAETTYIGRDNSTDLTLETNGVAIDASILTRAVVSLKSGNASLNIDSASQSSLFNFTSGNGVIKIKLGLATGLAVGEYQASLTVYDATNTQGIVWGNPFSLRVLAAP